MNIATEQPPFARRLLDALPFTIWSVDLEGRITAVNSAWARFASDNGAPDIAPEWAYKSRNAPDQVPRIGEVLAELRGTDAHALSLSTTANALAALPRLALSSA